MMIPTNLSTRYRSASKSPNKDHSDDSSWVDSKDKKSRPTYFTAGQVVTMVALSASLAAVLTALFAVYSFSNSLMDVYSDHMVASTTRSVISHTRFGPAGHSQPEAGLLRRNPAQLTSKTGNEKQWQVDVHQENEQADFFPITVPAKKPIDESIRPHVAWLMSFPNSGTSFTIHMTREATNCTTATNYALEGDIKDQPSVPAIPGKAGEHGPFLELIPNRFTNVPDTILTKTHCKGFCSGRSCGPEKTVHTVRSFMMGCLSGTRAIQTNDGLEKVVVTYDPSLVTKAIHIFRHPLDNIVARFHLEYNVAALKGKHEYAKLFPKNATGFHRWCSLDNQYRDIIESHFMDNRLKEKMRDIPCMNEFYRYVQWHNLAFATSQAMALPTMILHYHEYSTDFQKTRDRVLDWVGLPRVGKGIEFHPGKVYRSYYSPEQKRAIRDFLEEVATADTWQQIKDYDYETDASPTTLDDSAPLSKVL